MNIKGVFKANGISGDEVVSLNWGINQSAVGSKEQGKPKPSKLNLVVKSIESSHEYFKWANSVSDKKDGSIVFVGNEFVNGTPVVIKFKNAICSGFSFSFSNTSAEAITFSLQLSMDEIEYSDSE